MDEEQPMYVTISDQDGDIVAVWRVSDHRTHVQPYADESFPAAFARTIRDECFKAWPLVEDD